MPDAEVERLPLVLLPGMNCSARLWPALEPGPVINAGLVEPRLDAEVDRLLELLPQRFALLGLSLGGIVAMALARTAPGRVARLGLMSTNPRPPTPTQLASWQGLRDRLAAGENARALQRDLLPQLLSPRARAERPQLDEIALRMADEVGDEGLDRQLQLQSTRVDERPGLTRLRCPTVIIAARDDALCGVDRHTELARLIPGARLTMIKNCGHLSPLERPATVAALIQGWLTAAPTLSAP